MKTRSSERQPDYRALFERVYGPLCRFCLRLTDDPDLAEDAAQAAFIRLVENQVRGDTGSLRGWLFTTARNEIRDRKQVDRNRQRLLETYPPASSPPTPPDIGLARKRRRIRVRAALDGLPARDREILFLRAEGLSYQEIAQTVDVAATSVGTLLARARERLRDALREDGTDEAAAG